MNLYSDFLPECWHDKGKVQSSNRSSDYHKYDMFREVRDSQRVTYYMRSDAGDLCTVILYGVKRDPLQSIGHCYLQTKNVNDNQIITGVIVEGDCVEMKEEFLGTLRPEPPKRSDENDNISLGLLSDLQSDKWTNKGQPPWNKSKIGFSIYNIRKNQPDVASDGTLTYYLSTDAGEPTKSTLKGAARDPIKSMASCYLKICDGEIKGIILENDWVEMI